MSSNIIGTSGAAIAAVPEMEHNEILAAQHIFRVVLDALSRPGTVQQSIQHPQLAAMANPPHPAAMSILIALMDHEVTLGFDANVDSQACAELMRRWLTVQTVDVAEADFVLATLSGADSNLPTRLKTGSLDYPNDGATLVIEVDDLTAEMPERWVLTGPGIEHQQQLHLPAGSDEFMAQRNDATAGYPPGIDLIFVDAQHRILGLPRTTRCERVAGGGN